MDPIPFVSIWEFHGRHQNHAVGGSCLKREQATHSMIKNPLTKCLMSRFDTGGEVENDALFHFECVHSEREN